MLFNRRFRFALLVLASELLLIASTIAWLIHMILIAKNTRVYFVEQNIAVLYGEIFAVIIILVFASIVFFLQIKRLNERRKQDDRKKDSD